MRYHYREQVNRKKAWDKKKLLAVPVVFLVVGAYTASTMFSPMLVAVPGVGEAIQAQLQSAPEESEKRLYIPKIAVNEPIRLGAASPGGVWHHKPEAGNPKEGSNFTICAPSFSMGWNPLQTREQSPFYNLGKLAVGDQIFVDFEGERYGYEVSEKLAGVPGQTGKGQRTKEPNLMLYPCSAGGVVNGSDVFIAKSLGEVETLTFGSN